MLFAAGTAPAPRYVVTLANGALYSASIAGTDRPDDLAMLKITAPRLRVLLFANSDRVQVVQLVLAIGNPLA